MFVALGKNDHSYFFVCKIAVCRGGQWVAPANVVSRGKPYAQPPLETIFTIIKEKKNLENILVVGPP